jgi:hypothetical protein
MGNAKLLETRRQVERGWWAVNGILVSQGRQELAAQQVRRFSAQMPPPSTDRESIAEALRRHTREVRTRNDPPARWNDAAKRAPGGHRAAGSDDAGSNQGQDLKSVCWNFPTHVCHGILESSARFLRSSSRRMW